MLKIRDDVDLEELEKFGFKYGTREKFEYKKVTWSRIKNIHRFIAM